MPSPNFPAQASDEPMLLPCPLCGNKPKLVDMAGWEIVCQCGINLCLATPTIAPLIAAWNRRATEGQAQTSAAGFKCQYSGSEGREPCTECAAQGHCDAAQLADITATGAPESLQPVNDPLTERKTDAIISRGYKKVGYVLQNEAGEYCLSAQSAVRWLKQPEYWRLMHEQDGSLFTAPTAQQSLTAGGAVPDLTYTVDGEVMSPLEYINYLHDELGTTKRKSLEFQRVSAERGVQIVRLEIALSRAAAPLPQVQSEALELLREGYAEMVIENGELTDSFEDWENRVGAFLAIADQQPVTPSGALADNDGGVAK